MMCIQKKNKTQALTSLSKAVQKRLLPLYCCFPSHKSTATQTAATESNRRRTSRQGSDVVDVFWHTHTQKQQTQRQTSAGMRLFTDLDQRGLFTHFRAARDGSDWQVHRVKIPHHTRLGSPPSSLPPSCLSECADCICFFILFFCRLRFSPAKADSFRVTTCFSFSLSGSIKLFLLGSLQVNQV